MSAKELVGYAMVNHHSHFHRPHRRILVPITHVQMEVYALQIMVLPFVTAHLASQEAIVKRKIFVPLSNAPMAVRVWKRMKGLLVTVLLVSLEVIAKRQNHVMTASRIRTKCKLI